MRPTRQFTPMRRAIAAVALVLGSALSFALGQEAHAVVSRLPLSPSLSDVVSQRATGALGLPVPAPQPHRTSVTRQVALRHTPHTWRHTATDGAVERDPVDQCAPGDTLALRDETVEGTPAGSLSSEVLICERTDPDGAPSYAIAGDPPAISTIVPDPTMYILPADGPSSPSMPRYVADQDDRGFGAWQVSRAHPAEPVAVGYLPSFDRPWQPLPAYATAVGPDTALPVVLGAAFPPSAPWWSGGGGFPPFQP